jgi:hypothetical protein
VAALLKEIIASDDNLGTLVGKVNMLRNVYANTFGSKNQRKDDEMSDEIPF